MPWEDLAPGPIGEYLEVIDYDPAAKCFYDPVNLDDPYLLAQDGLPPSEGAYFSDEDAARNSTGRDEVYVRPFPNTGSAKWQVSSGGGVEPRWSRDGRELYYKNFRGDLVAATVLPGATFAVGKQRVLFSTEGYVSNRGFRTYDVTPDGRFVMIRLTKPGPDELIWVENFFEELQARVKPGPGGLGQRSRP